MAADSVRTLWTYEVIVYGHFADGAESSLPSASRETRTECTVPGWPSPRETLCHQIEHHVFWDLPSIR